MAKFFHKKERESLLGGLLALSFSLRFLVVLTEAGGVVLGLNTPAAVRKYFRCRGWQVSCFARLKKRRLRKIRK
jgi:hypothetical protein